MTKRAFVMGAGGAVGEAIALRLAQRGWRVRGGVRTQRSEILRRLEAGGVEIVACDLSETTRWSADAAGADAVVFTTNLAPTAAALRQAALSCERLVVFSSNNVAADPSAPTYQTLAEAERTVRALHPGCTIIRPTMIYGDPRLPTLTRVARFAKRYRILPLIGGGRARIQPVFFADLGASAATLCESSAPSGVFAIGGPEVVTMRELYHRIRAALGEHALVATVPRWALAVAAPLWHKFGIDAEQLARADKDRVAIEQDALPREARPSTLLALGLEHLAREMKHIETSAGAAG
ncbi:MAG: NAD(P)H-binding protein [Hyphomonadaceae bacterium]|nr:NAD(P)H-binding protein [Hyphomonadaceae bacterium]